MKNWLLILFLIFTGHGCLSAMEKMPKRMERLNMRERDYSEIPSEVLLNFRCVVCKKIINDGSEIAGKDGYFFHERCCCDAVCYECPVCKKTVYVVHEVCGTRFLLVVHQQCKPFLK